MVPRAPIVDLATNMMDDTARLYEANAKVRGQTTNTSISSAISTTLEPSKPSELSLSDTIKLKQRALMSSHCCCSTQDMGISCKIWKVQLTLYNFTFAMPLYVARTVHRFNCKALAKVEEASNARKVAAVPRKGTPERCARVAKSIGKGGKKHSRS